MNAKHVVWGLALAVTVLAGCDKEDAPANPAPASPAPPTPDVTPKTSGGTTAADATGAGTSPRSSGRAAVEDAAGGVSTTTTPDRTSATTGKAADDPATAGMRRAEEHLSKTAQHLKDKKPDLARKSLAQAEAMRASLPKTLREQIKTMRANVDSFSRSENLPLPPDEDNK